MKKRCANLISQRRKHEFPSFPNDQHFFLWLSRLTKQGAAKSLSLWVSQKSSRSPALCSHHSGLFRRSTNVPRPRLCPPLHQYISTFGDDPLTTKQHKINTASSLIFAEAVSCLNALSAQTALHTCTSLPRSEQGLPRHNSYAIIISDEHTKN